MSPSVWRSDRDRLRQGTRRGCERTADEPGKREGLLLLAANDACISAAIRPSSAAVASTRWKMLKSSSQRKEESVEELTPKRSPFIPYRINARQAPGGRPVSRRNAAVKDGAPA